MSVLPIESQERVHNPECHGKKMSQQDCNLSNAAIINTSIDYGSSFLFFLILGIQSICVLTNIK